MGRQDIDNTKIVIYGRSLGGAVAIELLSLPYFTDKVFAMIVENTFTSIPHMADQLISGLNRLPIFCFRNQVLLVLSIGLVLILAIANIFYSSASARLRP